MIQESAVLLRVEHLEESTGRVAVYPLTDLVDLIDEDQRVLDTNAFECLDDFPRQCPINTRTLAQAGPGLIRNLPDVSPPMTFDLGDVGQTSDGKSEEFSLQRPGNRLSN
jgi:hypothetical protein